jgi:hypothetical protein
MTGQIIYHHVVVLDATLGILRHAPRIR